MNGPRTVRKFARTGFSRGFSVIPAERSAQPLPAINGTLRREFGEFGLDDFVPQPLVVALMVIMKNELQGGPVEAGLSDQNHLVQAGLFDAPHKSFREPLMPNQEGARGGDGGDPLEPLQPDLPGLGGQPSALIVVEPGPFAQLLPKHFDLFLEVFGKVLLVTVNPARQAEHKELKQVHFPIMRSRQAPGQHLGNSRVSRETFLEPRSSRACPEARIFGQNERKSMTQKLNKKLLQFFTDEFHPGAICLVGTRDALGLSIREAQRKVTVDGKPSLWSHCFILGEQRWDRRGPGNSPCRSPYLFESDLKVKIFEPQIRNGAQENWVGKWCSDVVQNAAVINFDLTDDQRNCVLATALQLVDEQVLYPIGELLGTWWAIITGRQWQKNPLDDPHAMYCSSFVRHCYKEAGIDFMRAQTSVSNTTPEDIAQAGSKRIVQFQG